MSNTIFKNVLHKVATVRHGPIPCQDELYTLQQMSDGKALQNTPNTHTQHVFKGHGNAIETHIYNMLCETWRPRYLHHGL